MIQRLILRHGDCVEVLKGYEDGSLGAVVSDPPYGLSFMGKKWDDLTAVSHANRGTMTDWQRPEWETSKAPKFQTPAPAFDLSPDNNRRMEIWHLQWLTEAYRVLRPGGVIKAFSGTRTYHRMVAAMQEAGFADLRLEAWNYGSGFPKSLNIGMAIDKVARGQPHGGFDPLKRGGKSRPSRNVLSMGGTCGTSPTGLSSDYEDRVFVTPDAQRFRGWGTALKPSWEPVLIGRKPE
jgi:site-specific DNA-methyltransferase (adenine-specific)